MHALNRLVRFLKGSPRCLVVYNDKLNSQSWTSSQTATGQGVRRPRRSTSSSYGMLGRNLLAATTQNVVATSSGEAEFYGVDQECIESSGRSGHGC